MKIVRITFAQSSREGGERSSHHGADLIARGRKGNAAEVRDSDGVTPGSF